MHKFALALAAFCCATPALADGERAGDFDYYVLSLSWSANWCALTGDATKREDARAFAAEKLEMAYAWLEGALAGRSWASGDDFDCAAAPSLFYADWTHPISDGYPVLRAYRSRLLARPSVALAVEGGRPFRHLFPLGAPDRD